MMRTHTRLIFTLLFSFIFFPNEVYATDWTQYSDLVCEMQDVSSKQILDLASQRAAEKKDIEAIVLCSVVASRFRDDMNEEERNLCTLAHLKAGDIYNAQSNYSAALSEYIEGVKISESCSKPIYAARLYNKIGNIYCIFLDYEKGISYYLKAYDFCRDYPDRDTEHYILVNLTGIYTFLKKNTEAKKYYRMAEKTKNPADPVDVFMSGYTLSLIQIYDNNVPPAIARLKQLVEYASEKKIEPKYLCFAYQEIYNAYNWINQPDSILKYLRLCDETARQHNIQHTFTETLKSLSAFYEKEGDIATANMYKTRYLEIKDSIYNMREFDIVENTLFTYEVNKTTREIADLRMREQEGIQTIRVQRVIMSTVGIVAVLTALFLFIVWRQKKKLNRSYTDLYTVNRDFIDTQEQLMARLRKDRETLKEKEREIAEMKEELGKARDTSTDTLKDAPKYQTSNLTDAQRQKLAEAIQNIMENTLEFCDCDFSLDTLAELVGSNRVYVSQVINDTFHKNFNNYINPYRIHLACARFTDTATYKNFTMKAIAESVGFKSYTSFVNVFRKVTGITPFLYQKMASQGIKSSD